MRVRITAVDPSTRAPPAWAPVEGCILPRGPEAVEPAYHVVELDHTIPWGRDGGAKMVSHLILTNRRAGGASRKMRMVPVRVDLAGVPAADDPEAGFQPGEYAAVGVDSE